MIYGLIYFYISMIEKQTAIFFFYNKIDKEEKKKKRYLPREQQMIG